MTASVPQQPSGVRSLSACSPIQSRQHQPHSTPSLTQPMAHAHESLKQRAAAYRPAAQLTPLPPAAPTATAAATAPRSAAGSLPATASRTLPRARSRACTAPCRQTAGPG